MVTPRRTSSRATTSTAPMKRKSVAFNEGHDDEAVAAAKNPPKRVNGSSGFTAVNHQTATKTLAEKPNASASKSTPKPVAASNKSAQQVPDSPEGSPAPADDDDKVEEYDEMDEDEEDEPEEKPASHPLLNTLTALRSEVYTALNDGIDSANPEDVDWLSESIEGLQIKASSGLGSALSRNVLLHCQTLKVLLEIENLRCQVDCGDMTETELEIAIKGDTEIDGGGSDDESSDATPAASSSKPPAPTPAQVNRPGPPPPLPNQQGPPPHNPASMAMRPKMDQAQAGAPRPNSVTVPVPGPAPQHQHQAPPHHGHPHQRPPGPPYGPPHGPPPPPMRQPIFLAILTSQRWDLLSQIPQLWVNVIPGNRYLLTTDGTIVDQNTRFYMMIRQKSSGHIMTKTRVSWPNEWQNPHDIQRAIHDWHAHWAELTKPVELPKPREEKAKIIKIVDPSGKNPSANKTLGDKKPSISKADKPKRETKKYTNEEYDWSKQWVLERPDVDWKNVTLSSEAFKDMLKALNTLEPGRVRLPNAFHTWLLRQRIIGKGTIKPGRSHLFNPALDGEDATPGAEGREGSRDSIDGNSGISLGMKREETGGDDDGSQLSEMDESDMEELVSTKDEAEEGDKVTPDAQTPAVQVQPQCQPQMMEIDG